MSQLKKAEKSRLHAKQRREEEAKEITKIVELLPLPHSIKSRLDKASILRLAITFLRLKQYVGEDVDFGEQFGFGNEGSMMLEALSGFFLIVSAQEEILFVSENVEKHIGLNQLDMIGQNVYEFVFDKDQPELLRQFEDKYKKTKESQVSGYGINSSGDLVSMDLSSSLLTNQGGTKLEIERHRQFFLRMKCNYSKKQPGICSQTQSDYVLLQWTGYIHHDKENRVSFMAAVARPLQPTPIMELRMDGNMFISRHSLDMRFMYCDPRLSSILGYEPDEISGSSMYQYHHPADLEMCGDCHNNLMMAGTSISKYYRFLSKDNQWCWLQTRATIVYNTAKHPQYIVCMNYVVSEREGRRYLIEHANSSNQPAPKSMKKPASNPSPPVERITSNMSDIQISDTDDSTLVPSSQPTLSDSTVPSHRDSSSPSTSAHSHNSPTQQQPNISPQGHQSNLSPQGYNIMSPQGHHNMSPQGHHNVSPQGHHNVSPQGHHNVLPQSFHVTHPDQPMAQPHAVPANQTPQFYLPHQGNPIPGSHDHSESHERMEEEEDDLALGNMWLSVHSLMDPTGNYYTQEIAPPSLASELEDLSFEHCNQLMKRTTSAVVEAYAKKADGGDLRPANPDKTWETASNILDRRAQTLFKRFKSDDPYPVKRSRSSATLICSRNNTRGEIMSDEYDTPKTSPGSAGAHSSHGVHHPGGSAGMASSSGRTSGASAPSPATSGSTASLLTDNSLSPAPEPTQILDGARISYTPSVGFLTAFGPHVRGSEDAPLPPPALDPSTGMHSPMAAPHVSLPSDLPTTSSVDIHPDEINVDYIEQLLQEYPDILDSQIDGVRMNSGTLDSQIYGAAFPILPDESSPMVSGGITPNASLMSVGSFQGLKRVKTSPSNMNLERLNSEMSLTSDPASRLDLDRLNDLYLEGTPPSYPDNYMTTDDFYDNIQRASQEDLNNQITVIDYWLNH